MFNFFQLQECLNSKEEDKFVVAFYINSSDLSQDEWMDEFARELKSFNFLTIGIVTQNSFKKAKFKNTDLVALLDVNEVCKLQNINVFIILDVDGFTLFPETSKILAFVHALGEDPKSCLPHSIGAISQVDGLIIPFVINPVTKVLVERFYTGFFPSFSSQRKSKLFSIMPYGYPRLAVLFSKLQKINSPIDSIIYAPVKLLYNPDSGGDRILNYGKRLIRNLLQSFPKLNVIFRPSKIDFDATSINEICELFANESRFIIDKNESKEFAFSRGKFLITDMSYIANTFTYSTLRPSIFFKPWLNKNNNIHYEEHEVGYTAYSYSGLIKCLQDILLNEVNVHARILNNRNNVIVPFEDTFYIIGNILKDFYEDKIKEEWLVLQRNDDSIVQSDVEIIKKLLMPGTAVEFTSIYGCIGRPKSPLMAAFLLHIGKLINPQSVIWTTARKNIISLLNKDIIATTYEDVDKEDILYLYKMALKQATMKKDYDMMNYIPILIDGFLEMLKNNEG